MPVFGSLVHTVLCEPPLSRSRGWDMFYATVNATNRSTPHDFKAPGCSPAAPLRNCTSKSWSLSRPRTHTPKDTLDRRSQERSQRAPVSKTLWTFALKNTHDPHCQRHSGPSLSKTVTTLTLKNILDARSQQHAQRPSLSKTLWTLALTNTQEPHSENTLHPRFQENSRL